MSRPSVPLLAALACAAAVSLPAALVPRAAWAAGCASPPFAEFGYGHFVCCEHYMPHDLGAFGWNAPLLTVAVYNHPEPPFFPYYRAYHHHGWGYHRRRHQVAHVVRGCPCRPEPRTDRHRYD
jgi:hypothetical protein